MKIKCGKCKEFKEKTDFHRRTYGSTNGVQGYCKVCIKIRNKKKADARKKAYENWF